jgi:hypothetical protein
MFFRLDYNSFLLQPFFVPLYSGASTDNEKNVLRVSSRRGSNTSTPPKKDAPHKRTLNPANTA